MRRAVTIQEPFFSPGRRPSKTALASVRLTAVDPLNRSASEPGRFSTTRSEESRSPYFEENAPA